MDGAFHGGAEAAARLEAGGLIRGAIQQLQLQPQRRQRRAQLVRGVGYEGALRGEGLLQAPQQAIQLADQGLDFPRQVVRPERPQAVRIAALHFGGHILQRR